MTIPLSPNSITDEQKGTPLGVPLVLISSHSDANQRSVCGGKAGAMERASFRLQPEAKDAQTTIPSRGKTQQSGFAAKEAAQQTWPIVPTPTQTSEAFAEESEEQGSGCSFHLQVETELSGLCEIPRSPTQTSEAFAEESEEQGSGCSFHLQVETELSGLCDELSPEARSYLCRSAHGSAYGTRSGRPSRQCWRPHDSSPCPTPWTAWR